MKRDSSVPGTDLLDALAIHPTAAAAWKDLTPIAQRDFRRWVHSAKHAETRRRRIERACEMVATGKRRPCCYAVVPLELHKALAAAPRAQQQWKALTPDERRDLIDWIESGGDRAAGARRIEQACARLAAARR